MSPSDSKRKLVYVVEDDEEQLTLLRMVLHSAGFDVVTETGADRVLTGVRSLRPDVVLLDVMLPSREGLDGFQLCQQLRSDPELGRIPVLIVSAIAEGVGDLRDKVRTQVGADDFFVKPYDPSALVKRIRELTGA
mgnify:CR=1 FL=1